MPTSIESIVLQFPFAIGLMLLSYLVGKVAHRLLTNERSQNIFKALCLGYLIASTIYAIYNAAFQSILLGNIGLTLLWLLYNWQRQKPKAEAIEYAFNKTDLAVIAIFFTLAYFTYSLSIFNPSTSNLRALVEDPSFYWKLSAHLRDYGQENIRLDYFLPEHRGLDPYHYAELWLTALISKISGQHTQFVFGVLTPTLLHTALAAGLIQLAKHIQKSERLSWLTYASIYGFFLLAGFEELYPTWLPGLSTQDWLWSFALTDYHKQSPIYLGFIWMALLLAKKQDWALPWVAAYLAINHTLVAPALFLGLGVYGSFIAYQQQSIKPLLTWIAVPLATTVFIAGFYALNQGSNIHPYILPWQEWMQQLGRLDFWQTGINTWGKLFIQTSFTLLPYLVLYLWLLPRIEANYQSLLLICSLTVAAVCCWIIMHRMTDAPQLWSSIYLPMIHLIAFGGIILALKQAQLQVALFAGACLLATVTANAYTIVQKNAEVKALGQQFYGKKFAYLRQASAYGDSFFEKREQVYHGKLHTLSQLGDTTPIVCLSIDNIPTASPVEARVVASSTFGLYQHLLKEQGKWESIEASQQQFAEEFGIDFLLVDQPLLPGQFSHLFEGSYIESFDGYYCFPRK